MYVNSVAVVGNLTSDPRAGEGDGKVANFRLAVNRRRKQDKEEGGDSGESEVQERTEFLDVECLSGCFGHACIAPYLARPNRRAC